MSKQRWDAGTPPTHTHTSSVFEVIATGSLMGQPCVRGTCINNKLAHTAIFKKVSKYHSKFEEFVSFLKNKISNYFLKIQ